MIRHLVAAGAAAALLTACGASAPEPAPTPSESAVTPSATATPMPSPTPTYATPQQLASVIASHEAEWREVLDGAMECREAWVEAQFDPEDPLLSARSLSCHMREATITMSAEIALRELGELDAESSMVALVAKTTSALKAVQRADVNGLCDTMGDMADTEACKDAHLSALWAYSDLEKALDGWGPYL